MICVFLDSNILHSKSTDFTKARFAEKLEELIGEIEVNDLYTYVKLVIPQVVISELRRQQIDDCTETVRTLRKTKVTDQVIELPLDYEKTCDAVFDGTLDDLQDGTVNVDIAPYPPNDALQGLIQRAISKQPPFEGKEKESDKGFKDALIWESLLDYKRNNATEELAFYDALTKPENIKDFYENETLIALTRELTEMLRKNRTIDWQKKETARAGMRKMVKRLLKKYKYPPEGMEDAVKTVMIQPQLYFQSKTFNSNERVAGRRVERRYYN